MTDLASVVRSFNPSMISPSGLFEVLWAWAPEDGDGNLRFNTIVCSSLEQVRDALSYLEPIDESIAVRYAAPAAFIRRKAKAYRLALKRRQALDSQKQLELF